MGTAGAPDTTAELAGPPPPPPGTLVAGEPAPGQLRGPPEQATPSEPWRYARNRVAWPEVAVVFVVSLGLAMAMYHAATLAPLSTQVGGAGDADEYSWFLSWLPFSLGHGLDPLLSRYVNFPGGVNLMWNTSVVLPSFLVSPLTVIFGAALSYNVLLLAGPVGTMTCSFIAFRRWATGLPAFAGALVVGFSPYMVAQSAGHLAQVLLASAPLLIVLLDRALVVQRGRAWVDGLLLGLLAWAQLLTSEEILVMEALTAAVGVAFLCIFCYLEVPARLRYGATALGVGGASFAVLSAPFLAVQFAGPYRVQDAHPPNAYVSDLLNFVVPTDITKYQASWFFHGMLGTSAAHIFNQFSGNGSEDNAYIGIPLLLFLLLTLALARRRPVTWVALVFAAWAAVLSMGPTVHIHGTVTHDNLPLYYLAKLPVVHNVLPDRFASMMTVGVGLLVALGLDALGRLKWPFLAAGSALAVLGMAALLPITDFPAAPSPIYTAFSSSLACPKPAPGGGGRPPVVLMLPTSNELNLRWQAESKFCFVIPTSTGMTGTNVGDIGSLPVLLRVANQFVPMPAMTPANRVAAAQEIRELHIQEIAVGPELPTSPPWTPTGQAQAVAWVQWLLGQGPLQSKGPYISYYWKDLPPVSQIASGTFSAGSSR